MRLLLVIIFALGTVQASAETIPGFSIEKIASDTVALSDRFGTSLTATEHLINLSDCYKYLSLEVPLVCSTGTSTGTDATDSNTTTDATDNTDGSGSTDSSDGADSSDGSDSADGTDSSTANADGTDSSTDASDGTDAANGTDSTDGTDAGDGTDSADGTDAGDETDSSDGTDATDSSDATDSNDNTGSGSDGTDNSGAMKPTDQKADDGDNSDNNADPSGHKFTISLSMQSVSDGEFAVAVGTSCSESENPSDGAGCTVINSMSSISSFTGIEVVVPMNALLGTSCSSETNPQIYFYLRDNSSDLSLTGDTTTTLYVSKVEFELDYTAPPAPTISDVSAGEGNIIVDWTGDESDSDLTYSVYWSESTFTSEKLPEDSSTGLTTTEKQIADLKNSTTYYVGVVAVDKAGNRSEICDVSQLGQGKPVPVDDFFEYYKRAGGTEEGGFFCQSSPVTSGASGWLIMVCLFFLSLAFMRRRESIQ